MKRPTSSPLTVTWYGHSAFTIESSRRIILFDPWLENPNAPPLAKEMPRADLILVSHGHSDHVGNTVELAARTVAGWPGARVGSAGPAGHGAKPTS